MAFQSGIGVAELAARYGLRPNTVAAILTTEKLKYALSPSAEYRVLRGHC